MFQMTSYTKQVTSTREGRDYELELPGRKPLSLLWSSLGRESFAGMKEKPDATHFVQAHTCNLTELAALTLACLDELQRYEYFADDSNGPPPTDLVAHVSAYISRQLVITHNQLAAEQAEIAQAEANIAHDLPIAVEDWAGPF